MMINSPPLRTRLDTMIAFFQSDYPELADGLQGAIRDIEKIYEKAHKPFGAGHSLEWFESEYTAWCQRRELQEPSIQEQITKAIEEGKAMGDFDDEGRQTEKSVARHASLVMGLLVNRADDEERGLDSYERMTLEYTLAVSLAQVRDIGRRHAG